MRKIFIGAVALSISALGLLSMSTTRGKESAVTSDSTPQVAQAGKSAATGSARPETQAQPLSQSFEERVQRLSQLGNVELDSNLAQVTQTIKEGRWVERANQNQLNADELTEMRGHLREIAAMRAVRAKRLLAELN